MLATTFHQHYAPPSVPDPNRDPHDFGPPGSRSISQRYGSGLWLWLLLDFLSLKNYVSVPSQRKSRKTLFLISFLLASWRSLTIIAGSGSESGSGSGSESKSGSNSQRHGSPDPDPHSKLSWIRNTAPPYQRNDELTQSFLYLFVSIYYGSRSAHLTRCTSLPALAFRVRADRALTGEIPVLAQLQHIVTIRCLCRDVRFRARGLVNLRWAT